MSELKVKKTNAPALVETRSFKRGACVHATGDRGQAWRVLSGSVRLDTLGPDGLAFASLALAGDVIGAEALVGGHYTFHARADALRPGALEGTQDIAAGLVYRHAAPGRRSDGAARWSSRRPGGETGAVAWRHQRTRPKRQPDRDAPAARCGRHHRPDHRDRIAGGCRPRPQTLVAPPCPAGLSRAEHRPPHGGRPSLSPARRPRRRSKRLWARLNQFVSTLSKRVLILET